ncbi:MAG TPA: trypsin-like peptidase domain-containing protein [Verrucomicrobiae bacterium]|nr:trypsin-like peptidase domain-containing protein [Verrucomicrobiae bacterium]
MEKTNRHRHSTFCPTRWFALLLCAALVAFASSSFAEAIPASSTSSAADLDLARHLEGAFERVADQASPSVVVITTKHKETMSSDSQDGDDGENGHQFDGSPFEFFFRHMPQQHVPDVESQGSGIILRKDGYILTNQHVIDGGGQITVLLKDGTKFTNAVVVGVDDRIDVAVIKVNGKNLPAAKIGDSDIVKVGQWAIAIGAPYELDYTFTVGFVSAKGRSGVASHGGNAYEDYIQTDAAINPGNSGGPLCDIEGDVIGINTLIRGLNRGIGFAIPINMAMDSAEKIIKDGKVKRPWIGIGIEDITDARDLKEFEGVSQDGVVVNEIREGTPAAKSDLQPADVIMAVDGTPVKSPRELQQQILHKNIGQKVVLSILRGSKKVDVTIQTDEMPDQLQTVSLERHVAPKTESVFGLTVQTLSRDLAERLKIPAADGVVVMDVADGSAADARGLKRGDIITSVDRTPAHTAEDFVTALSRADQDKGVLLFVQRGKATTFVVLKDSK